MDPFTITAVALAVGGGIIGGMSARNNARKQNKRIGQAAQANIEAVDQNILQARMAFYDRTEIASSEAQRAYGQARNIIGFDSGISTTQYLAAAVADAEADQLVRRANLEAQTAAFQHQKEVIRRQAKAGMVDANAAAIQGGIQGAQTGLAIGGALQSLASASQSAQVAEQQSALLADQRQLASLQIDATRQQLDFQRRMNLWQNQQFGSSLDQWKALNSSPFRGSTYFDWMGGGGFGASNPILPPYGGR